MRGDIFESHICKSVYSRRLARMVNLEQQIILPLLWRGCSHGGGGHSPHHKSAKNTLILSTLYATVCPISASGPWEL